MNSKNNGVVTSLFLSVSLLFCILASACDTNPSPNVPKPPPTPKTPTPPPTPISKPPPPPTPTSKPPPTPTIPTPYVPASIPPYYYPGKCDALKLGVCANVLNLVDVVVGSPPTLPCCSLIHGVDLEAALCLCTAIRANILGINLNVPVALSLVLNNCGKKVPSGFECY